MFHSIERTISQISSHFVGVLDHIEDAIDVALSLLGQSCNASRAYIFLFDETTEFMSNSHEWCGVGIQPEKENLQNLPIDIFPWWMAKLKNNEMILVEDVSAMGDEAVEERNILQAQDIKSVAVMPLLDNAGLIGFIGLDNVEASLLWSNEEVALLKMASEMLGSAFTRLHFENDLRSKNLALSEAMERQKKLQAQLIQREKMAGIGVMAAGIAHEVNNPLGFILSNVDTLKSWARVGKPALDVDEFIELIDETETGLKRIANIISGLMHFTRPDENALHENVVLKDLIDEVLLLMGDVLIDGIVIDYSKTEDVVIKCNRSLVNQVFMNIILNAIQSIHLSMRLKEEGKILVWAVVEEEFVRIFVSDNGSGIPPELIGNIFDPFFTTKPEGIGTGLGLSEAYQIVVKIHSGELMAVNNQEGGATLVITLPQQPKKGV